MHTMQRKQTINPILEPYLPFIGGLANILGKNCEVLLHDTSIPEASVVACANTHVTGREIGAPMTAFGRRLMQSEELSGSEGVYNYHAMTEDGRRLRCSVIYLRDKKKKLIGLICINIDLSKAEQARTLLDEFLDPSDEFPCRNSNAGTDFPDGITITSPQISSIQPEKFYRELDDVWAHLLQELKGFIDVPLERLSYSERLNLIAKLDKEGFFLIKGSINFLAKELGKSRYTIYGYLRKLRD